MGNPLRGAASYCRVSPGLARGYQQVCPSGIGDGGGAEDAAKKEAAFAGRLPVLSH